MEKDVELLCMELISNSGAARSCFIEAIEFASNGEFCEAEKSMKRGRDAFKEAHDTHLDILSNSSNGDSKYQGVLVMHAEDQLMSAESFEIIAERFIDVIHRLKELEQRGGDKG